MSKTTEQGKSTEKPEDPLRNEEKRDRLTDNLIDNDKIRVFIPEVTGNLSGAYPRKRKQEHHGQDVRNPGTHWWRQRVNAEPDRRRDKGSPGSGSQRQVTDPEAGRQAMGQRKTTGLPPLQLGRFSLRQS